MNWECAKSMDQVGISIRRRDNILSLCKISGLQKEEPGHQIHLSDQIHLTQTDS